MRINQSTSFPHPVLAEHTGDYIDRKFSIHLEIEEIPSAGAVFLQGSAVIDDPSVQKLIEGEQAKFGLMIYCQDTYLDQFVECPISEINVDLSGGRVRGTVHVRGVIISTKENLRLTSEHIVQEFPVETRVVNQGEFIALSEELSFEAGLEKLVPLESIFRLKRSEDTPEGQFELGLESEAIEIYAHPALYDVLHSLRGQASMRDLLIPSLYLPVVISVLDAMQKDNYADKRWYSIVSARCNAEGIDAKSVKDIVGTAQRLLYAPLGLLKTVAERVN